MLLEGIRVLDFGRYIAGPFCAALMADKVGFDTVAQAMSGAMHLSGLDGQPTRDIVLFEDYGTSLFAAFGAICALYEKQKSGEGQCVDTYQTRDGWIVVSVVGNPVFKRWTALVQHPDLFDHPDLQDDQARAENVQLIDEVMRPWCQRRSCKEALAALDEVRISCGEVYDLPAVRDDPQVKFQHLLKPLRYPGTPDPIPIADTPVHLSRTPASIRSAPPTLGQDTDNILISLGYVQTELLVLREKRVI